MTYSTLTYWFYVPEAQTRALIDDLADLGLILEESELSVDGPLHMVIVGGDAKWRARAHELHEIAERHGGEFDGCETGAIVSELRGELN